MVNVGTFNFNSNGQMLVTTSPVGNGTSTGLHEYDEASIASGAEVTVLTYTVPVNKQVLVFGYGFGGYADGKAKLEIDGAVKFLLRNSGAQRTMGAEWQYGILVDEGVIINIKITNEGENLKSFEAAFNGILFDAP